MIWRLGGGKQVEVHVALFADIIVLMQKQENRLVLRTQSVVVASKEKIEHGPVIKLQEEVIVQPYAAGVYCQEEMLLHIEMNYLVFNTDSVVKY